MHLLKYQNTGLITTGLVAIALTLDSEAGVREVTLGCLRRNDSHHPHGNITVSFSKPYLRTANQKRL